MKISTNFAVYKKCFFKLTSNRGLSLTKFSSSLISWYSWSACGSLFTSCLLHGFRDGKWLFVNKLVSVPGGPLKCCNWRDDTTIWSLACKFECDDTVVVDDVTCDDGGGVFGVINVFEFADELNNGVWSKSSWGLYGVTICRGKWLYCGIVLCFSSFKKILQKIF